MEVTYMKNGQVRRGKVIGRERFNPRTRQEGDFLIVKRHVVPPGETEHVLRSDVKYGAQSA